VKEKVRQTRRHGLSKIHCKTNTVKPIPYGSRLSTAASSEALRLNSGREYKLRGVASTPGYSLPTDGVPRVYRGNILSVTIAQG